MPTFYVDTKPHVSGDGTTAGTGDGGTNSYVSLAAALTAQKGDLTGKGVYTFRCRASDGDADTTMPSTSGYTTTSSDYIEIVADDGHHHVGIWDDSKYRLLIDGGTAFEIQSRHTRLRRLQIGFSGTVAQTRKNISAESGANSTSSLLLLDRCILRGTAGLTNADSYRNLYINTSNAPLLRVVSVNCLMYGHSAYWNNPIYVSNVDSVIKLYHCTILSNSTNEYIVRRDGNGSVTCVNCYFGGSKYNCIEGAVTQTTNATSDASAVGTDGDSIAINTTTFKAPASSDYRLPSGSPLIGLGTDGPFGSSGDPEYFTDDIAGNTRSSWDIGAFEYVASAKMWLPNLKPQQAPIHTFGRFGG